MAIGRPFSLANATTSSASFYGVLGAGDQRGADLLSMCRACTLSPSASMAAGRRADPDQPGVDDGLGERGVLGEEAVAGVDGVGTGLFATSMIFSIDR